MTHHQELHESIPDILRFRPRWWWDPVPDWIIRDLDRNVLVQLATVQIEAQRAALQAQLEATTKTLELLQKQRQG